MLKPFLDEKDIRGGDAIPNAVRKSIQQCDELIVLLSPYSVERQWVLIEIGVAWGLEKRIVPIIDKIAIEQMPDMLAQRKAIDPNRFDEYLDELEERVLKKTQP